MNELENARLVVSNGHGARGLMAGPKRGEGLKTSGPMRSQNKSRRPRPAFS
jgi:hypothetical protein